MHIFKGGLDTAKERISKLETDLERSFQKEVQRNKGQKEI